MTAGRTVAPAAADSSPCSALRCGESVVLGDEQGAPDFNTRVRTRLLRYDEHGASTPYVSVEVWEGQEPTPGDSFENWVTLDLVRRLRDRLTELLNAADPGALALVAVPDEARIAAATEALRTSGIVQHGRCVEVIECAVLAVLEAAGVLPVPGVVSGDE